MSGRRGRHRRRGGTVCAARRVAVRQQTVLVQGRPLRLQVRRSHRARRASLRVSGRTGVEVVLPPRMPAAEVPQLVAASADWLARQASHHGVWDGPRRRNWASGSELTLLGEAVRLELTPLPAGRVRPRTAHRHGVLRLELPPAELLDPRPALVRWVRRFAGRHLRARTAALAAWTGLQPSRVIVGERTSRWGSCSGRGTLSFCYRLVLAPAEVVDAVVVHELCHLARPDHGPRFYQLVRSYCPRHDEHLAWLRAHGHRLEI